LKSEIAETDELIQNRQTEKQQNCQNYDNLLKTACMNFQNELMKLSELHKSKKLLLEKELARLKEEFFQQMQKSTTTPKSTKVNKSDTLVMKVR